MKQGREKSPGTMPGGLAGWLLGKMQASGRRQPRLALLERISLAPKQSLSLVEAEGRKFLVATSADGSPSFYPLDERTRPAGMRANTDARKAARVTW